MGWFSKRVKATEVDSEEQLMELIEDGKPVLVDFWQTNCQPCRTMDGIIDELAEEHAEDAHVVKVNVQHAPHLAAKARVMSTPTFVVLAGGNATKLQPRFRQSGLVKKDQLSKAITREV